MFRRRWPPPRGPSPCPRPQPRSPVHRSETSSCRLGTLRRRPPLLRPWLWHRPPRSRPAWPRRPASPSLRDPRQRPVSPSPRDPRARGRHEPDTGAAHLEGQDPRPRPGSRPHHVVARSLRRTSHQARTCPDRDRPGDHPGGADRPVRGERPDHDLHDLNHTGLRPSNHGNDARPAAPAADLPAPQRGSASATPHAPERLSQAPLVPKMKSQGVECRGQERAPGNDATLDDNNPSVRLGRRPVPRPSPSIVANVLDDIRLTISTTR